MDWFRVHGSGIHQEQSIYKTMHTLDVHGLKCIQQANASPRGDDLICCWDSRLRNTAFLPFFEFSFFFPFLLLLFSFPFLWLAADEQKQSKGKQAVADLNPPSFSSCPLSPSIPPSILVAHALPCYVMLYLLCKLLSPTNNFWYQLSMLRRNGSPTTIIPVLFLIRSLPSLGIPLIIPITLRLAF